METNENLTEKLEYIGLDLNNIPDELNFFQNINFRVRKNYIEENYKVYKYVNVNDIEIFLTPTHRLTDYTEKYAKSLPIGAYLNMDTEENIERNVEFLKLLKELQIEDIEALDTKQKELNKNIPYNVSFDKDYLWQIFYSDIAHKYFMLMPIKETECTALFYVIKKQLENKDQMIYVPICYADYSNKYIDTDEIDEIEKYLCFFAKDWPMLYEVYDKDENLSIQIVGKATIYDTLKSEYKIELKSQGEAEDFYKLVKALFILETQLSYHYKFKIKLDKKGSVHFIFDKKEITYKDLVPFIKKEYIKGLEKLIKAKESKINLEKKLKKLKDFSNSLDKEYYEKEKQISTFLECKKTFFGRVRYFIKYKKVVSKTTEENHVEKEEKSNLKYCERTEIKEVYTLEELLTLYKNLDTETANIKDLELDIEAMEKRIGILELKIKNANLYIKEIDNHKKSIFEFWKFTNKDDAKQLNEGTQEVHQTRKLKKTFNYELDFEDLSKQIDKAEREIFTKEETDDIFIASTNVLEDINDVLNGYKIAEEHLNALKEEMVNTDKVITFDIFGSISSSKDQIKTLGNIKHRENEKNKFAVLNIKDSTTLAEYKDRIEQIIENIKSCLEKYKNTVEIPIYKARRFRRWLKYILYKPRKCNKACRKY